MLHLLLIKLLHVQFRRNVCYCICRTDSHGLDDLITIENVFLPLIYFYNRPVTFSSQARYYSFICV
jgi:hypothetical protein